MEGLVGKGFDLAFAQAESVDKEGIAGAFVFTLVASWSLFSCAPGCLLKNFSYIHLIH